MISAVFDGGLQETFHDTKNHDDNAWRQYDPVTYSSAMWMEQ